MTVYSSPARRLAIISVLIALVTIYFRLTIDNGPFCAYNRPAERATVVRVIDGDTIEVITPDGLQRVRYIGIDTPERGEPYSRMATDLNEQYVLGQIITMFKGKPSQDAHGRLLRYVFVNDVFVNSELLAAGMATTMIINNHSCQTFFDKIAKSAQRDNLGFWAWVNY